MANRRLAWLIIGAAAVTVGGGIWWGIREFDQGQALAAMPETKARFVEAGWSPTESGLRLIGPSLPPISMKRNDFGMAARNLRFGKSSGLVLGDEAKGWQDAIDAGSVALKRDWETEFDADEPVQLPLEPGLAFTYTAEDLAREGKFDESLARVDSALGWAKLVRSDPVLMSYGRSLTLERQIAVSMGRMLSRTKDAGFRRELRKRLISLQEIPPIFPNLRGELVLILRWMPSHGYSAEASTVRVMERAIALRREIDRFPLDPEGVVKNWNQDPASGSITQEMAGILWPDLSPALDWIKKRRAAVDTALATP